MEKEKLCVNCGATIHVTEGYPEWCPTCDWGLLIPKEETPRITFINRLYDRLSNKQAKNLLERALKGDDKNIHFSFLTVMAYVLAVMVYALMLVFVAAALFMIYAITRQPGFICIGSMLTVLFMGLAWIVRPQLGKMPKDAISRDAAPELYLLCERIADALGARRIKAIVLGNFFTAYYAEVDLNRKPILGLGLPLLISQTPQELVALISHELAHGVNGDVRRGAFLSGAINALQTWNYVATPFTGSGMSVVAMAIAFVMLLLSAIPNMIAAALAYLTFNESQLAEYRADAIGAKISGSGAAISSMRKIELASSFQTIAQRNWARRKMTKTSVWDEMRQYVAHLPESELARFARIQQKTKSRLDDTHPPTEYRIQALIARQTPMPLISLSNDEYARIMSELGKFEQTLERDMMGE